MAGKLLDVKQVQDILGLSERTVFRLIRKGELKGFKAGREWRFEESDITEYIAQQRRKAEQMIQPPSEQDEDFDERLSPWLKVGQLVRVARASSH